MPIAHLEPIEHLAYRLRVGPDGWVFGEPNYDYGMVVEDMGGHVARISLLYKYGLNLSHWRAIREVLVGAGFERAIFERHRSDGTAEMREIRRGRSCVGS
jgi:hypothetical protein